MKDRADKGFTVIQAYVLRGLGKKHSDGNASLVDATLFIDRDPTRPNEEFFKNVDWLDFNSIQSGHNFGSDSYAFVSKDYALTPAKPTVDMEPAYENHPTGENKPRDGTWKAIGQHSNKGVQGFVPPSHGAQDDWVLVPDATL
jgi:hypothetical protein